MIPPVLLTTGAKLSLAAALAAGLFLYGVKVGYGLAEQEWQAAAFQAAARTIRVVEQQQIITHDVVTKYVKVKGETRTVFETIEKEIPRYVEIFKMQPCVVHPAFVRLWNDANSLSSTSPAASGADAQATPVTLSDVARQHTREAEQYAELADQLRALQEWVERQYALGQEAPAP
jgi:hypothetical protein